MTARSFNVHVRTGAFATVPVTLSADDLAGVAANLGKDVADLTHDDLRELLTERALENTPAICHHCSGGNWTGQPYLELGDEWEVDDKAPVRYVLTEVTT